MSDSRKEGERSGSLLEGEGYTQRTADLYDVVADWYAQTFWNDQTDADWIEVCRRATRKHSRLLDVGSGPGNYARYFAVDGHRVICADISKRMALTAAANVPQVTAVAADMRALPFVAHSFDVVFCAYSINHVTPPDLSLALGEFRRVLDTGGVLCLMLKTGSGCYEFTAAGIPTTRGTMCLFPPSLVLRELKEKGLPPFLVRFKSDVSKHEFEHRKMLVLGRQNDLSL